MTSGARFRRTLLIYNPMAGWLRWKRQRDLRRAAEILSQAGIAVSLRPTAEPGSATRLAREALAGGHDLVIVCGGDGTINEALQGLALSQVPLAILPSGTANILAKELGLPWNIPRAARLIPASRVERISLGRADDRYFISLAGVGADAATIYRLGSRMKFHLGMIAYWFEGFRQLLTYSFPRFRLESCGRQQEAVFAVISKTRHYGGPLQITRRARLRDNEFEVAVFHPAWRFKYLWYILAVWLRQLERSRDVSFLRTARVRCQAIEPGARIFIEVDGELAGTLPREFEIVPEALSLLIPPNYFQRENG